MLAIAGCTCAICELDRKAKAARSRSTQQREFVGDFVVCPVCKDGYTPSCGFCEGTGNVRADRLNSRGQPK